MLRNYTLESESEAIKAVQHKERRHLFNKSSTCYCEVSAIVYRGGQTIGELGEKSYYSHFNSQSRDSAGVVSVEMYMQD